MSYLRRMAFERFAALAEELVLHAVRKAVRERKNLPQWDPSGLTREVARVDVDVFIRRHLPDYRGTFPGCEPDTGPAAWKDSRWVRNEDDQPVLEGGDIAQLRLRCLVVLSRLAIGKVSEVRRADVDRLAASDYEHLVEEYLENTARIDPMEHDLPAMGLAHPLEKRVAKPETAPARALAMISRSSNGLFLGAHAPYLQDFEKAGPIRFALLAPRPPEG